MKRFLFGCVLGLAAGVAGSWYYNQPGTETEIAKAQQQVTQGAEQIKESIQKTIQDIRPDQIKEELARSGTVVREKARQAGQAIVDATADARISASIKAKLARTPGISSLRISVDTTDGLVTLSGSTKTHDEIARAVKIALETEGVHKVISTIQVTSQPAPAPAPTGR